MSRHESAVTRSGPVSGQDLDFKADGRKLPDCYADPPAWRDRLQAELD